MTLYQNNFAVVTKEKKSMELLSILSKSADLGSLIEDLGLEIVDINL